DRGVDRPICVLAFGLRRHSGLDVHRQPPDPRRVYSRVSCAASSILSRLPGHDERADRVGRQRRGSHVASVGRNGLVVRRPDSVRLDGGRSGRCGSACHVYPQYVSANGVCGASAAHGVSMTMRQLSFVEPNRLEWHEVPRPRVAAETDALVRPVAVARCDLDLYVATGTGTRGRVFSGPFAIGHEAVGVVTDAGRTAGVVPGDTVVVSFQLSCGRCGSCRRGFTSACGVYPPRAAYGLKPSSGTEFGGALAELMYVPFADH